MPHNTCKMCEAHPKVKIHQSQPLKKTNVSPGQIRPQKSVNLRAPKARAENFGDFHI